MTMRSNTFCRTLALGLLLGLASVLPSTTEVHAVAARDRWATVRADATLVRGRGVTDVLDLGGGGGFYEVEFDKKVVNCLYVATLGTGSPGTAQLGEIGVAPRAGNQNAVFIVTRDSAGIVAERPFHLFVGCR